MPTFTPAVDPRDSATDFFKGVYMNKRPEPTEGPRLSPDMFKNRPKGPVPQNFQDFAKLLVEKGYV